MNELLCSICLFVREKAENAVTVMNGHAVCLDHESYAQGGDHAQILVIVRRNEGAPT